MSPWCRCRRQLRPAGTGPPPTNPPPSSFPFLVARVPPYSNVLTHARASGYNQRGEVHPKVRPWSRILDVETGQEAKAHEFASGTVGGAGDRAEGAGTPDKFSL